MLERSWLARSWVCDERDSDQVACRREVQAGTETGQRAIPHVLTTPTGPNLQEMIINLGLAAAWSESFVWRGLGLCRAFENT
jgi:hypothetical protein